MEVGGGERGIVRGCAPAKVNLSLRVLARERSGYHQLETIFCALELHDEIEIERGGGGLSLEVEGAELGPPEENLVYRAAVAFHGAARVRPDTRIRLRKRIPAGAGLGGGSSDAAATLTALNALYGAPLEPADLLRIGAELGSDVPYFLCGSPFALAWGRGERLLALTPPPSAPALVVVPPFSISTPEAYRDLAEYRERTGATNSPAVLDVDGLSRWDTLADLAVNDFEPPTFERHPELERLRDTLALDARIALLSGSGSALFAVYPDAEHRAAAAERVRQTAPEARFFETRTVDAIG